MPGRDGTGPLGAGSVTGRGGGVCSISESRRSANFAGLRGCGGRMGRRCGDGFGRGFGIGNRSGHRISGEGDQKDYLERSAVILKKQLAAVNRQLEELGN